MRSRLRMRRFLRSGMRNWSVRNCMPGMKGAKGSCRNEWMVTPPALMAAMPVGASTTMRLCTSSRICRRKVVFPVPARPVRKRLVLVFSMIWRAKSRSGFSIEEVDSNIAGNCTADYSDKIKGFRREMATFAANSWSRKPFSPVFLSAYIDPICHTIPNQPPLLRIPTPRRRLRPQRGKTNGRFCAWPSSNRTYWPAWDWKTRCGKSFP